MKTSAPYEQHARAFRSVLDSYGADCPSVNWNGKDRRVIPTTSSNSSKLQAGGFYEEADLKFATLVSEFTDQPNDTATSIKNAILESVLTYEALTQFKVQWVKIYPGALQFEMGCNLVNQQV